MFGEHLEKRLKQMASDMIEACAKRYDRFTLFKDKKDRNLTEYLKIIEK